MTTVAWDGRYLAADSLVHGNQVYYSTKIWKLQNGILFAGCGDRQAVIAVKNYLSTLARERILDNDFSSMPARPTLKGDFSGIFVANRQAYRIEEMIEPWEIPAKHACGSGCDFAISAMAFGRDAMEAVEFAKRFDLNTGGEIEAFDSWGDSL